MPRLQLALLVTLALLAGQARAEQAPSATSPDGKRIASGDGKSIHIKDAATQKVLIKVLAHKAEVTALAWSPDGKLLASADGSGKVNLLDVGTGRVLRTLQGNAGTSKVAFSPDGRKLQTESAGGKRTFEVATGKEVK
jgi:WD40 repeat protein